MNRYILILAASVMAFTACTEVLDDGFLEIVLEDATSGGLITGEMVENKFGQ